MLNVKQGYHNSANSNTKVIAGLTKQRGDEDEVPFYTLVYELVTSHRELKVIRLGAVLNVSQTRYMNDNLFSVIQFIGD